MTSFKVDPDGLDELSRAVRGLLHALSEVGPKLDAACGSAALDEVLADFGLVVDRGLAELDEAMRRHGLTAAAAGHWYRQVDRALAAGR
ncbi:MAG: hypothetical protein ABI140_20545 [Jatrophihabitantaceae bacterium]